MGAAIQQPLQGCMISRGTEVGSRLTCPDIEQLDAMEGWFAASVMEADFDCGWPQRVFESV